MTSTTTSHTWSAGWVAWYAGQLLWVGMAVLEGFTHDELEFLSGQVPSLGRLCFLEPFWDQLTSPRMSFSWWPESRRVIYPVAQMHFQISAYITPANNTLLATACHTWGPWRYFLSLKREVIKIEWKALDPAMLNSLPPEVNILLRERNKRTPLLWFKHEFSSPW